jgi:hypothetical protein
MKLVTAALAALVLVGALAPEARAQQGANMSVAPTAFSYPSGDPDTTPIVTGPQLTISYKVTGGPIGWTITVQGTDLTSGPNTIPASNVTWGTATPQPPFVGSGTLSTTAQRLAGEVGNHAAGTQTGYVTFSLKNLWTYNAGTYTHTITFTISIP